jgi:hypothetical protein
VKEFCVKHFVFNLRAIAGLRDQVTRSHELFRDHRILEASSVSLGTVRLFLAGATGHRFGRESNLISVCAGFQNTDGNKQRRRQN